MAPAAARELVRRVHVDSCSAVALEVIASAKSSRIFIIVTRVGVLTEVLRTFLRVPR